MAMLTPYTLRLTARTSPAEFTQGALPPGHPAAGQLCLRHLHLERRPRIPAPRESASPKRTLARADGTGVRTGGKRKGDLFEFAFELLFGRWEVAYRFSYEIAHRME